MTGRMIRVAAVQFAGAPDVDANLATILRLLDEAAGHDPDVVITPEFANHPSVYDDGEHAWQVAVDVESDFTAAIAAKAREHAMNTMVCATVRRGRHPDGRPNITVTNLLFGRDGSLLGTSDKQVLMGAERTHLTPGDHVNPVIDVEGVKVGLYSCMEGVIFEPPRALAVRGTQLLLNSLNSFALDEASLHIPVRAAENKVWVVAANKVGDLLPPETARRISEGMGVPTDLLVGGGESQVVAPDGSVVAMGSRQDEQVVVADIEIDLANRKSRSDGTDVMAARRPELYAAIGQAPTGDRPPPGAEELVVATVMPGDDVTGTVQRVAAAIEQGAQLVVLPELAARPGGASEAGTDADDAALLDALRTVAGEAVVVTSVLRDGQHAGVAISGHGEVLTQPQLHASARHSDSVTSLGDAVAVASLPWGRLAVVVGDDAVFPETFRLAALQHAEVVAVPFTALEEWETRLGLLERAAENRLNVVAATRPTEAGSSVVLDLHADAALWGGSKRFDGTISYPVVSRAEPGETCHLATVHPAHAAQRMVSLETDLVDGRPWRNLAPLLS